MPAALLIAFAVASIRPTDLTRPVVRFRIGPDSFTAAMNLKSLIQQAYEVEDYQVAGGPSWAQSQRYDVQAKTDQPVAPQEIRLMLQDLLADRFSLKFHRETRTMQGYVLSVDKGGPKLPAPRTDIAPESRGSIQIGGGEFLARGASMKNLAVVLGIELGQPALDQTGIGGNYDFRLRFDEANHDLDGPPGGASAPPLEPRGSIFTALHEMGLKLEARKVEIEVLVVDSASMPTAN